MSDDAAHSLENILSHEELADFSLQFMMMAMRVATRIHQRPVSFEQICFSLTLVDSFICLAHRLRCSHDLAMKQKTKIGEK